MLISLLSDLKKCIRLSLIIILTNDIVSEVVSIATALIISIFFTYHLKDNLTQCPVEYSY